MKIQPGTTLRNAIRACPPGTPLELEPGAVYVGGMVSGLQGSVHIIGNRATVKAGLKLEQCGPVTIEDLNLPDAPTFGLRVIQCPHLILKRVRAERCGTTGILGDRIGRADVIDCEGLESKREHGLYLSGEGGRYRIEGGRFSGNRRTGIHLNARPGRARSFRIANVTCEDNPTAAIQLAGVEDGVLVGNVLRGGRVNVVVWDDGGGKRLACRDIDCSLQPGSYQVSPLCERITLPEGVVAARPGR